MAQPRLTPRQRMINMMYLVLTALLALNVSKETLDVIAKVDRSLNEMNENYTNKSEITYSAFDKAYTINPTKVEPWKIKSDALKAETEGIIDLVNKFKWDIVRYADGDEADLEHIKNMDDLNKTPYIMLETNYEDTRINRGVFLKNAINEYRDFLLTLVDTSDSVLFASLGRSLDVSDIPSTPDEPGRSWEEDNFRYLPLIGVITLMTKMQSDIRNAESDVLNYLYKGIDEESFTFNDLVAMVKPKSSTIIEGSTYEASIFLSAIDTTQDPEVFVANRPLPVEDGQGKYSVSNPGVGKHKWGGIIRYKAPDGSILPYEFEEEYEVLPAALIVSPTKMNVFYQGLKNPVQISAIGATPENTTVSISSTAKIQRVEGFNYIVEPNQNYGETIITVSAMIDGRRQTYPPQKFRLHRVPDPVPMVNRQPGGNIAKQLLVAQVGIEAVLEDFLFEDYQFIVQSFTVSSVVNSFTEDEPSNSYRFTQAQKNLISQVPRNGRIFIDNIKAMGPDGEERDLPGISFVLQ